MHVLSLSFHWQAQDDFNRFISSGKPEKMQKTDILAEQSFYPAVF